MDGVNHKRPILTYPIASGEMHYGPRFRYRILGRGNVSDQHIIVRINGRDARYLDGADTPLHSGDTISVASTIHLRHQA